MAEAKVRKMTAFLQLGIFLNIYMYGMVKAFFFLIYFNGIFSWDPILHESQRHEIDRNESILHYLLRIFRT